MYDDTERASPRSTAALIVSIKSSGRVTEICRVLLMMPS
jgi:hypothetical protein